MSLALFKHVRTLPDAELKAIVRFAELATLLNLSEAFDLARFEQEARAGRARSPLVLAGPKIAVADPPPAKLGDLRLKPLEPARTSPASGTVRATLTKSCAECGKVRTFRYPSRLKKSGPLCQTCNAKAALAGTRERRSSPVKAGDTKAEPATRRPPSQVKRATLAGSPHQLGASPRKSLPCLPARW